VVLVLYSEEYGGAGLDQISYGLIMQEIERGDSGTFYFFGSIVFSYVPYLEIW
jgi:alkylation response protein AidB-like acyl-CoA dehydrogenase